MSAPSIRELCQRASIPPGVPTMHREELRRLAAARREARDLLHERLPPDVVLKVVEALEIAERYLYVTPLEGALTAHTKVETALALLNATAQPTGEQSHD